MPTPTKGARLGGSPAHQRLMLGNLATALFTHGRITTTEAKAKRLRPFAERLITKSRKADLHNRREVMKVIRDKDVVHKLFAEIGPHFADRQGGYTRITKTLARKGDNAPMAVIELVLEKTATAEAEAARKTRVAGSKKAAPKAAKSKAAPKDEAPAADEVVESATEVPADQELDAVESDTVESTEPVEDAEPAAKKPAPKAKATKSAPKAEPTADDESAESAAEEKDES